MSETKFPASHPTVAQALKTAEANGGHLGLSRADAEAYLAERGITRRPDSALADYKAPARTADSFKDLNLVGVHGVAPQKVEGTSDGAKVLAQALQLDPVTAAAIGRDVARTQQVETEQVKKAVGADQYDQLVADVDAMLAGAKIPPEALKAAALSPHSLVQLATIARFRAAKETPK